MTKIKKTAQTCLSAALLLGTCGIASAQSTDYENTQLQAKSGLPPFEYMEAPAPLPNYTPNAQWGTQGEPITTMQKPLSPEESARHMVTFPEFDISMFASEPQIYKPLWLAFDERGRAWISETIDYPNELQNLGEGRDRLKILEDTNGDGKADKFTVFADDLSIPTGFIFSNGGVIVMHSGRAEFFKDTDGDDKADERKVLFEGWSMRDTHATVSHLRYGFDNWIWGTVGYSGFEGTVGGEDVRFGQGIFRFKPDGSKLEFIRSSNNNTWGLGLTEDNIIIGSTANGNASMYMPIPNRYYEAVNGWSAARLESIASSQNFYPITDKIRQVDYHGRYTAGCGSAIYTARSFPKAFWNRAQFVAEPTGHVLGLFFLNRDGADFAALNARNLVASDDEWTSPIYGEVGPDGAVWMADWYNYVIQHNPTPKGFETGRGSAYETPLRDKTHGRIYRVTYKDGKPSTKADLSPANAEGLVAGLKNDNMFWRTHAQRLLVERGNQDVVPQLVALVQDNSVDELGLNPAAIHALWTLQGLGAMDEGAAREAGLAALKHPSAGVRRAAVMVLPRTEATLDALLAGKLLEDDDAQVRMASMLALAELPSRDAAGVAIFTALKEPRNADDRWIPDAATAAAAKHDTAFIKAMLTDAGAADMNLKGGLGNVLKVVTTHYAGRGATESIVATLASLKGAAPNVATAVLDGLMEGWPKDSAPNLSDADEQQLESVMDALPELVRDRLLSLGSRWNVPGLFGGRLDAIVASLKEQVADASAAEETRAAAAKRWIALQDTSEVADAILSHVTLLSSPTLSAGLVNALSESRNDSTGEVIMKHWPTYTPTVLRAATSVLLRRSEWTLAMLDAVGKKTIARTDIAPEFWSQLRRNRDRRIGFRANRLADAGAEVSADRAAVVERLLPLAKEKGDAARGKEVFTTSCAVCHKFGTEGGAVGPDLTGIGSRDRSDILLEILDPNRSVEANFRLWTVTTKDGNSYAGRLEAETQTTVELLDVAAQKHIIQRKEIEAMEALQQSIMPIGFEALPADDIKALLEYLSQPH
ncbi:MAG: c-type cytochrome [Verrucomicrobiae bacterium]|nr:c-type cytochrome [Verrucomicrobiae bacterium]